MRIITYSLFVTSMALTMGCASGRPAFPERTIDTFKIGVTSEDVVKSQLGEPRLIGHPKNTDVWIYSYSLPVQRNGSTSIFSCKGVTLTFSDRVLTDMAQSNSSDEFRVTDSGGYETGQPFDAKAISELPTGTLGPQDVITRFGPPNGQRTRYDGSVIGLSYSYSNSRDGTTFASLQFEEGRLKKVKVDHFAPPGDVATAQGGASTGVIGNPSAVTNQKDMMDIMRMQAALNARR